MDFWIIAGGYAWVLATTIYAAWTGFRIGLECGRSDVKIRCNLHPVERVVAASALSATEVDTPALSDGY